MGKFEDYLEEYVNTHEPDSFCLDFELRYSQLTVLLLSSLLIKKKIITQQEFNEFMSNDDNKIQAFKELFEGENK